MLPLLPRNQPSKGDRNFIKRRIMFRDGRFVIPGADAWHTYWQEPYYLLLTVPWMGFLLLMALFYVFINAAFALAYLMGGDCIENAASGSFVDAFFFSVQTLSSIGYGNMYPITAYADTLVTTEALIGTLGVTLLTGLAFTKFSQPTARVMFSKVATICNHNGTPTLMLRAANQRRNQIIEAQIRVYLMRDEISIEGEYMWRFYLLKLLTNQTPRFTLSWTVMHPIDERSPLWQATSESLAKTRSMLIVSLSGIDETVHQPLHAPYSYAASEILWQHRFVDIFYDTPQGSRYIDYTRFHDAIAEFRE